MIYLWLKALHVAAVMAWLGGQMMLSLLLVSLSEGTAPYLPQERRLMVALRRWDQRVTAPAMGLVWLLGIVMAMHGGWLAAPWLRIKLVLVFALSALHGVQSGTLRRLVKGDAPRPPRFLRWGGAAVLIAAAAIAGLVVVKPFS